MKNLWPIVVPVLLSISICGSALSQRTNTPPTFYISKDACPFECCTYGNWTARKPLTLFDRPGGRSIGRIGKNEEVLAITGEIHTHPLRYRIARPSEYENGVPAGSVVYLLHPGGEGSWRVWFNGKVFYMDPSYDGPGPKLQWWAKVKLHSGRIGWVPLSTLDLPFDNVDACG